jgi:hypothetical protein
VSVRCPNCTGDSDPADRRQAGRALDRPSEGPSLPSVSDDELTGDIGAALPSLILPGGIGTMLGLLTGPLARASVRELKLLWSRPLKAATRIPGLTREELEERIRNNPRLSPSRPGSSKRPL